MVRRIFLLASLCCFAFSGCLLRGPEITVRQPVEVQTQPPSKSFCPPGQAKKGNC
jgi:hypothetical protein